MFRPLLAAALALLAGPALAEDMVTIHDAYLRALGPGPGAAFFTIENHADQPDRLTAVATDTGSSASLHNTKTDSNGMAVMLPIEGAIEIGAHDSHAFDRGGDHVMLMGLPKLAPGQTVTLTLTFEHAGAVSVAVPLDNARRPEAGQPEAGGHEGHGMTGMGGN